MTQLASSPIAMTEMSKPPPDIAPAPPDIGPEEPGLEAPASPAADAALMRSHEARSKPGSTNNLTAVATLQATKPTRRCPHFTGIDLLIMIYVVVYFVAGIVSYIELEGWTFTESLYVIMMISTTTGYGDIVPITEGGKLFTAFYALMGVGLFTLIISVQANRGSRLAATQEMSSRFKESVRALQVPSQQRRSWRANRARHWTRRLWHRLPPNLQTVIMGGIGIFILLLVGVLFATHALNFGPINAVYWSVVTGMSVGFGDVVPSYREANVTFPNGTSVLVQEQFVGGMWFTIIYIVVFFFFMLQVLSWTSSLISRQIMRHEMLDSLSVNLTKDIVDALDMDRDGNVDKAEFLAAFLVLNGVVKPNIIRRILDRFDELDISGDGLLSIDDVKTALRSTERKLNSMNTKGVMTDISDPDADDETDGGGDADDEQASGHPARLTNVSTLTNVSEFEEP